MTIKLLLTGATGFIGRQVLDHLGTAYEVHCTSRSKYRGSDAIWHQSDLRDAAACERLISEVRPDILVHAAWTTEHGLFWESSENDRWLQAGRSLFSSFADNGGRRIIGCGTCAEYGGESSSPRRESEDQGSARPASRYGQAKLELLQHLRSLPVEYAWARIFFAYGPGEGSQRLVPSTIRSLLLGEPALCTSGTQVRDFIDVRDLGRAIAELVSSSITGAINLGQGEECSIARLVTVLGDLAGRPDLIRLGALPDRPGDPPCLVPDLNRQFKELRFAPRIDLLQGLSDSLNSTLAQLDIP